MSAAAERECYQRITSPDNPRLKALRQLQHRRQRDAQNCFVIEGAHLLEEALRREAPIVSVVLAEDYAPEALMERLAECVGDRKICRVPRRVYERLSDAQNGSGVMAVVRRAALSLDALADVLTAEDNLLILDRVQDPGNIGTLVRTALAAGYAGIVALKGTADLYAPKVLRATAGAIFALPIADAVETEDFLSWHARLDRRLTVTDPGQGMRYGRAALRSGVSLVLGNEGQGVSEALLSAADLRVSIPMCGDLESLNVSVAAAILMYEAMRERSC